MLALEFAADRFQLLLLFGQFGAGVSVLAGQLHADAAKLADQRGRRRGAGKLHPKFLGGQADFQRLAVYAFQLVAEMFQDGTALVHVIGPPLDRLALAASSAADC